MPWLIKDQTNKADNLFFVHVPRCGGTSLMHHFNVPKKCLASRSFGGKIGMLVFFNRYKTLEKANFPVATYGNLFAMLLLFPGVVLILLDIAPAMGYFLLLFSALLLWCLTVLFTAPVIGRIPFIHRCYLIFVHFILCRCMESIEYCTGTNRTGYIMHLTAHKLLAYNYVTTEEIEKCASMAIVRNPYSRMVSIYNYNKFGSCESFSHFVMDWYKNVTKCYRERGELEEWYTPCHAIPQFEFTHFEGHQIVRSVVKQEELKYLNCKNDIGKALAQDSTVADLPHIVRDALLGMPHTNQRSTENKKWYEYYDQNTLDLVHEIYEKDFDVFNYSPILTQRPDLKPPAKHAVVAATVGGSVGGGGGGVMEPMKRDSAKSSSSSDDGSAHQCWSDCRIEMIRRSSSTPTSGSVVKPHFRSSNDGSSTSSEGRILFSDEEGDVENGSSR